MNLTDNQAALYQSQHLVSQPIFRQMRPITFSKRSFQEFFNLEIIREGRMAPRKMFVDKDVDAVRRLVEIIIERTLTRTTRLTHNSPNRIDADSWFGHQQGEPYELAQQNF